MFRNIFTYRVIAILIALFIFINSIAFTIGGILLSAKGILMIFEGRMGTEERPGLLIMESIDAFLLALVFLLFSIGIIKLFVPDAPQFIRVKNLQWLKIDNFTDLKMLLWEAVLTTLVVFFITSYVHQSERLDWKIIILPASILLLSISYFILKKSESAHHKKEQNETND